MVRWKGTVRYSGAAHGYGLCGTVRYGTVRTVRYGMVCMACCAYGMACCAMQWAQVRVHATDGSPFGQLFLQRAVHSQTGSEALCALHPLVNRLDWFKDFTSSRSLGESNRSTAIAAAIAHGIENLVQGSRLSSLKAL